MTATLGTITQHVWRFAGYLQLPPDLDRPRVDYEDAQWLRPAPDPLPRLVDEQPPLEDDELGSQKLPVPALLDPLPFALAEIGDGRLSTLPKFALASMQFGPRLPDKPHDVPDLSAGGLTIRTRLIEVNYQPGGDQQIAEIRQLNVLADDDVFINGPIDGWSIDWSLPAKHEINDLIQQADGHLPTAAAAAVSADADDLIGLVQGGHLQTDAPSVGPGLYVNGELATQAPEMPERPWEKSANDPLTGGGTASGTGATASGTVESVVTGPTGDSHIATGDNVQENVLGLYDGNEATASLIVMGDVFQSDAIFQVNALLDKDTNLGAAPANASPAPDNVLNNIAKFSENTPTFAAAGAGATPNWNVHVVDGHFIDVKSMHQTNLMQDNDKVITQTAEYTLHYSSGANVQANELFEVHDTGIYDIIVVMGSMYSYNWIYQKNVLVDSDQLEVRRGDEGGGWSNWGATPGYTSTGSDNVLWNEAAIQHHGEDDFQQLPASELALVQALQAGDPTLVPKNWNLQGDADGTLDVLFVKGSYFDLNFMFQTNVMSDVDAVGLDALMGDRMPTISTGGNTLANSAIIIDVGTLTTSQYAHGSVYSESVLVQTNIISGQEDVELYDTTGLAPEVIAFLEDAIHHGDDDNNGKWAAGWSHDDVVGSILH